MATWRPLAARRRATPRRPSEAGRAKLPSSAQSTLNLDRDQRTTSRASCVCRTIGLLFVALLFLGFGNRIEARHHRVLCAPLAASVDHVLNLIPVSASSVFLCGHASLRPPLTGHSTSSARDMDVSITRMQLLLAYSRHFSVQGTPKSLNTPTKGYKETARLPPPTPIRMKLVVMIVDDE